MKYFKKFPKIDYDFTIISDPTPIITNITDVTARVSLKISDTELDKLCDNYFINDRQTPEQISYLLYNSPFLHWTILYINNIINYYEEWPLTNQELTALCKRKYGTTNIHALHHYETNNEWLRMDESFIQEQIDLGNFPSDSISEVSNYDYENRKNELKRFIKVISPLRMSEFTKMFDEKLTNG